MSRKKVAGAAAAEVFIELNGAARCNCCLFVSGESLSALIQSASSIAAGNTQETHAHIHLKAHKHFVYSSSTANGPV